MRLSLASPVALVALGGGCQMATPDVPPAPVSYPDLDERELARLTDRSLGILFAVDPFLATEAGIEGHDQRLGLFRDSELLAKADEADAVLRDVGTLAGARLGADSELERERLASGLSELIARLRSAAVRRADPWEPLVRMRRGLLSLLVPGAADPTRLEALVSRVRQLPASLTAAKENVRIPAAPLAEGAVTEADSLAELIRGEAARFAASAAASPSLAGEFRSASEAAVAGIAAYRSWLTEQVLPGASGEFRQGATLLSRWLENEGFGTQNSMVLAAGVDELRRLEGQLVRAAAKVDVQATPGDLAQKLAADASPDVPAAGALEAKIRAFLESRGLVTLPPMPPVIVQDDPAGARAQEASLRVRRADAQPILFVDPRLRRTLALDLIHSGVPGEALLVRRTTGLPGRARKVFPSRVFTAGWGEYCEQMMVESGFFTSEPELEFAAILRQVRSACRLVAALRLHARDMTPGMAAELFREQGLMDEAEAKREALHAARDPFVLAGCLGRMEIVRLREDFRLATGSLRPRDFHDRMVSRGAIPIPTIRSLILESSDVRRK